jgi:hypothetical protein
MPEPKVSSIYIPQHCLQGEELPAHVLWSGQEQLVIEVRIPKELELREAYNVSTGSENQLSARLLRIREVDVPGYVGLVFRSRKLREPRTLAKVRIEVRSSGGDVLRITDREVLLFRPMIRTVKIPSMIEAVRGPHQGDAVEPRISMRNVGDATAFVNIEVKGKSRVSICQPKGADEFTLKFMADVTSGLEAAKGEFARYSRLLDRLIEVARTRRPFEQEDRRGLMALRRQAVRAYGENREFHSRVIQVVGEAYFKNLQLITEVSLFLDYLNSIGEGRVIVANALDVLKIPAGESPFTIQLKLADAALNSYPPITLPTISIVSDVAQEIPIHSLFDWCADSSERTSNEP